MFEKIFSDHNGISGEKPVKGSVIQKLTTARSRIDFGLNKADEVALNFETIYRGKGNYFERMENLGTISIDFNFGCCITLRESSSMIQKL